MRRGRRGYHGSALQADRLVEPGEQGRTAAEKDRNQVKAGLVHQPERQGLLHTVAQCSPTASLPATFLACAIADSTPSVTNVNTGGAASLALLLGRRGPECG